MTPISTGSTLMPALSNQRTAALTADCRPLISRQMMPISSVTLAWRMLVTTGNLRPNCQITGAVMSLVGYISQSRCRTDWAWADLAVDLRGGMKGSFSAAGDGGNDADLVAVAQGGFLVLEEANVLLVDIDVDEAPQGAGLVGEAFLD